LLRCWHVFLISLEGLCYYLHKFIERWKCLIPLFNYVHIQLNIMYPKLLVKCISEIYECEKIKIIKTLTRLEMSTNIIMFTPVQASNVFHSFTVSLNVSTVDLYLYITNKYKSSKVSVIYGYFNTDLIRNFKYYTLCLYIY
jgi:hypothetical protein